MTLPPITALVPHASIMVLLDRATAADANSLTAEVTIRPDSVFCDGAGVGAWVGIEYMAQAIAAFAGYEAWQRGEAPRVGFLLGTRGYDCRVPRFAVGQRLVVRAELTVRSENGVGAFQCTIHRDDELLVSASLTVFEPRDVAAYLSGNPD